jgi:hypothetical protein
MARTRGKGRSKLGLLVAAGALGAAAMLVWPRAEATPTRTEALEALCSGTAAPTQKLIALEELGTIDTSASRDALKRLADCEDERTAMMALGALSRLRFSGALTKIEAVYEDTDRSDVVRAAALTAYCTVKSGESRSWGNIKRYVKDTAGRNTQLRATHDALKTHFWAEEADDE